jgi:hypothetical protein
LLILEALGVPTIGYFFLDWVMSSGTVITAEFFLYGNIIERLIDYVGLLMLRNCD